MMNNQIINMLMPLFSGNVNPNQILQGMVSKNPQMNAVLNQMKTSGMTPMQFLQQYAKQNNIDLKPYMDMLAKKGIK